MSDQLEAIQAGEGRKPNGGQIHTWSTTLLEAKIVISFPRQGFVGQSIQVKGVAFVKMRFSEFRKSGGKGSRETRDFYVTSGLTIELQIAEKKVKPQTKIEGSKVSWSHKLDKAASGPLRLKAMLSGVVAETRGSSDSKVITTHKRYSDDDVVQVTVDISPPQIDFSYSLTKEPPWYVVVQGTAKDPSGVESMYWLRNDGGTGPIQRDTSDWSNWHVSVPLPDRRQTTSIAIVAQDRAGRQTTESILIPGDISPPSLLIISPPEDPHVVLWLPDGITIHFEGSTNDGQTGVQAVMWQLDDDPESLAEPLDPDWFRWQMQVPISSPGVHIVKVWAIDRVGNASPPEETEIRVQE